MFSVYKEIKQKLSRINSKKRCKMLGASLFFALFYLWPSAKFINIPFGIFASIIMFLPSIGLGFLGSQKIQFDHSNIREGKIFSFLHDKDKPFDYFYQTLNSLFLSEQAQSLSYHRTDEYIQKQNEQILAIQEKIAYNQQVLIKLNNNQVLKFESLPNIVQNKFNKNHSELMSSLETFLGAMIGNGEFFDEKSQINQIMKLSDTEKLVLINDNLNQIYQNHIEHKTQEKLAKDFELTLDLPNTNKLKAQKTLSL